MPSTDARGPSAAYARSVHRALPSLLLAALASLCAPGGAAGAVTSRGDLRVTEGVRLSDLQFRTFVKDGDLRVELLLVGRATGSDRSLVLSAAPCRGTRTCRTESSRVVRFRRRPRAIVGWRPSFGGAAGIAGLRIRLAAPGRTAARATADVTVASTAWTTGTIRSSLFVREDAGVPVDAVHMVVTAAAGGGSTVSGFFTVRSTRAFDVRTTLGRCTPIGGCPMPDVRGTASIPQGRRATIPFGGELGPIANAERVRFRADGGVFPSPFVQMILPWPPA